MKATLRAIFIVLLATVSLAYAWAKPQCSVYMYNDSKNVQRTLYSFQSIGQEECCIKCQTLPAVTAFTVDSSAGCLCKTDLSGDTAAVVNTVSSPILSLAKRTAQSPAMNIQMRIAGELINFDAFQFFGRMAIVFHYPLGDIVGSSIKPVSVEGIIVEFHLTGSDSEVLRFQESLITLATDGTLSHKLNRTVYELIMTPLPSDVTPPYHTSSDANNVDNNDSEDDGLPLFKSYDVHVNRWVIRALTLLAGAFGLFGITYFIAARYYKSKYQKEAQYQPVILQVDGNDAVPLHSRNPDHVSVDVVAFEAA